MIQSLTSGGREELVSDSLSLLLDLPLEAANSSGPCWRLSVVPDVGPYSHGLRFRLQFLPPERPRSERS